MMASVFCRGVLLMNYHTIHYVGICSIYLLFVVHLLCSLFVLYTVKSYVDARHTGREEISFSFSLLLSASTLVV